MDPVNLGLASLVLFGYAIHAQPLNPTVPPEVNLHPSLPGKPRGYYKARHRPRQYYLWQRVLKRSVRRPIRDPPRTWWQPWTWTWTRRIPIPPISKQSKLKTTHERYENHGRKPKKRRQYRSKRTRGTHRRRRKQPKQHSPKEKWMRTTPAEREAGAKERFHNNKHRFLHQSSMMYGMQYGVNLSEFVKFIDPIKQFRVSERTY